MSVTRAAKPTPRRDGDQYIGYRGGRARARGPAARVPAAAAGGLGTGADGPGDGPEDARPARAAADARGPVGRPTGRPASSRHGLFARWHPWRHPRAGWWEGRAPQ